MSNRNIGYSIEGPLDPTTITAELIPDLYPTIIGVLEPGTRHFIFHVPDHVQGSGAHVRGSSIGYVTQTIRLVDEDGDDIPIPEVDYEITPPMVLEPVEVIEPAGLVRAIGRSFADNRGLFYPLGCTLFWALRGWKFERDRIIQHFQYLQDEGFNYYRMLGDVEWTPEELSIDSDWPDYQDLVREMIIYANDNHGLRAEITCCGGSGRSPVRIVRKLQECTWDITDRIMHWEIANEAYSTGMSNSELVPLGRWLAGKVPNLVSLSAPKAPFYSAMATLSEEAGVSLLTPHFPRKTSEDDWRFVRQPWDVKSIRWPISNNEGKGPLSSVASCLSPVRLATYRSTSILCGAGAFVLHNAAGVYGVPRKATGTAPARPANLWEVPNIAAINHAVLHAADVLYDNIESWPKSNHDWKPPNPTQPITATETATNYGPIRNYACARGNRFVEIPHGIKERLRLKMNKDVEFKVYNIPDNALLYEGKLSKGREITIPVAGPNRDNAAIIVGTIV